MQSSRSLQPRWGRGFTALTSSYPRKVVNNQSWIGESWTGLCTSSRSRCWRAGALSNASSPRIGLQRSTWRTLKFMFRSFCDTDRSYGLRSRVRHGSTGSSPSGSPCLPVPLRRSNRGWIPPGHPLCPLGTSLSSCLDFREAPLSRWTQSSWNSCLLRQRSWPRSLPSKGSGTSKCFSVSKECLVLGPVYSHVVLRPRPGYVPKVPTTPFHDQVVNLQALPSEEADPALALLCPVRALRIYVDRTRSFRSSEQLFALGRWEGCNL